MKKAYSRGFTLIELLVVIAIIGLLAGIVITNVNSARTKGRDTNRIGAVNQLKLALELYFDAHNAFPPVLNAANLVTPGYISAIPTDPSSSVTCTTGAEAGCYHYVGLSNTSGGTCTSYHLGASLETSGHSVLSTDVDATATTTCAGVGSLTDFNGADNAACGGSSTDAGVACYDLKP